MIAMAWNVAAYSLLLRGQVIRKDFFYFLTGTLLICAIYAAVFLLAGPPLDFQILGMAAIALTVAILTHALLNVGSRLLDRLFFVSDVQLLRANLSSVMESAARTEDLESLITEAKAEIEEVSSESLARGIERALRTLNSPTRLAECGLGDQLPGLVGQTLGSTNNGGTTSVTRLDQSRALRDVLVAAIEKPKPADSTARDPAALEYAILREEYLQALPNKQIMARYSISESSFHRLRRQAIRALAQDLGDRERQLGQSGSS
jgi:hypothetical protein